MMERRKHRGTVIFITIICVNSVFSDYDNYQELSSGTSEARGLFPNIFNLATNSLIHADATCGQHQREIFCKLVEHVFNRQPQCDVCYANDIKKRHPIEFAIDGTRRWWQSPSLANGLEYERVNITIDLRQEYQVAYVIVKSAIAPRPGTWILEKSLDGVNYEPWQYYAISDAECMRQFGVPATVGVPRFTRDDEVICTSYYSKLDPLENGEIHTSLVNGRPSAETASETLQRFTRARFVRLNLISLRTLNADLMVITHRDANSRLDHSVTRRYFYAIKDISIGGQCICHGHAESCSPDPVTGQSRCECRHNTCGESCNQCCPLYNQHLWRQGTQSNPHICQPCQCFNHADRCEYDEEVERLGMSVTPEGIFEGGGRCMDCKHNTDGINCERCKWTYYRPAGITHYRTDACRPCDCDPVGSEHNNCVRDENSAIDDQKPGDCICKPGFGGRRCDVCAPGYRNHPKCEPCPCNQAGSVNFNTCEEEKCICKANVEGLYCDRCKEGTINLNVKNPQGCQPCFCFGLGTQCVEKNWDRGQIRSTDGWKLTDHAGEKLVSLEAENDVLMYNTNELTDRSLYYWKAPKQFTGNLLNSYGGHLQYYVYYVPMGEGRVVPIADLIIEGNGIRLEYHSRQEIFARENISIQIPIKEGVGWYNSKMRVPVDKNDMMRVLANVDIMLIRAIYHQTQVQSSIYGLTLDTALEPKNAIEDAEDVLKPKQLSDALMRGVEICQCPEHYAGYSCESCEIGYRRVNNQLYGGRCEKCNCQGHTSECNPYTGDCINCQHNTTGVRCEHCEQGFYGNPSLGGEAGVCKPCACPTVENSHSKQCALTPLVVGGVAAVTEDAYVCTACETGYDGNKCEVCADGFFGDPTAPEGKCEICDCSGNIDPMAIGNCDPISGKCLKCIYNTAGDHCEQCKEHHWGNPKDKSCRPCGCHPVGAKSGICDNSTGACDCYEHYVGLQCDRCEHNHGDVGNMCPPCDCNKKGSFGSECDEVSGQCACKTGVFGKHCDMCRVSYFNFSENGCQFCHCNTHGAIDDGRCDNITGKCECRANVEGNMCEKCFDGYFNITSGRGCQECACDSLGSESMQCDMHTGQCACKPGVTGSKCNKCAPNYFGLDADGCKQCQVCPAPGHVCDPVTGDCVCPPNTVGLMCENCTANSWKYDPYNGCTQCDCSSIGADGPNCNPINGQCNCRKGFVGLKCDSCIHGRFNFPLCEQCNCDLSGSENNTCKDGVCSCDEQGQCHCKKNVKGLKCDTCDAYSFSLERSNPLGCTDCFCFNRTNFCVQSSLVWQQVYTADRKITFSEPWEYYTRKNNLNVLRDRPLQYRSYLTDITPLYWPLPRSFLGDRTASYNGYIRFKIENDDNYRGMTNIFPDAQHFRTFPQAVLVGNHRIILEHFPDLINENGRYKIRLHENHWRSRLSPEVPVTRKQLMIALQNLQGVYIRATYNYPSRGDTSSLKETSIDVAVWENTTNLLNSTAFGVEMCECPQGFAGNSCQDPAEGYCRKRQPDFLNSVDDLALVGSPQPCACNGHSTTCEPETCRCTNCEHNTFGDFCQYCKPGYRGDALEGHMNACTKCACPLPDNSFSETCVAASHGRGYICDACKPGYTGNYCEQCMPGYYGNPNEQGGYCDECLCHRYGSLRTECDVVTGQCECRPGVTGRDCSLCQARHAFINGVCASCDQGCTHDLMLEIDDLESLMDKQNFSNIRPIPWKRLGRIRNTTKDLRSIAESTYTGSIGEDKETMKEIEFIEKSIADVSGVVEEAKYLLERGNKSWNVMNSIPTKTTELIDKTQKKYNNIYNIIMQIKHYILHGGMRQDSSRVDVWMKEAQKYLDAIKENDVYIKKRYNRGNIEFGKSQELLKLITSHKLNDTTCEDLESRLKTFRNWLDAYRDTIWDQIKQEMNEANKVTAIVAKRIDRFNNVAANISDILSKASDEIHEAENVVNDAKSGLIMTMFDDFKRINETLLPKVEEMSKQCRAEGDKYGQLLDVYRIEFVESSEKHAEDLDNEAIRLQSAFLGTKSAAENAVLASNAYREIADALRNASKAAEEAKKAAEDAYIDADPKSTTSMVNVAQQKKNISSMIMDEAQKLNLEELDEKREAFWRDVKMINDTINSGKAKKAAINTQYQLFDDQHDRMSGLVSVAEDAEERTTKLNDIAQMIAANVTLLNDEAAKLKRYAGEGIRNITNDVRNASYEVEQAKKKLDDIQKQNDGDAKRIATLSNQINLLQEKIKEAREMASRIRISIKASKPGLCNRTYISPAHPAPSNTFSLKFRPLREVPNSLLFLTRTQAKRSQRSSEYIAMEVIEGRVVVNWDIGAGKWKVTNTKQIYFIAPSDRTSWYHIKLERIGNSMTLTVARQRTLSGEGVLTEGDPVTVSSNQKDGSDNVIFNTKPGETTIQFGCKRETADEIGLSTNKFLGVVGEFVVDGDIVPLWAFYNSTEYCEGDFAVPSSQVTGYMFRDGFAQVRLPSTERVSGMQISVIFSAYSPSGLLYFRGIENNGDFVCLELKDGHVVYKINLGDGSYVSVESKMASYSDGRIHNIRAIRQNAQVHLQVDSEDDRTSAIIPGKNAMLTINDDDHYVAGVPPEFNTAMFKDFGIQWNGFFGCIQSVKPSQLSELNLDNPIRSHRKTHGCLFKDGDRLEPTDRIIGFVQPGYLVTQGIQLSDNSTISFAFRTRNANATLLFHSSKLKMVRRRRQTDEIEGMGYMAFYLYRGILVVHLGTDASHRSKVLTIRSEKDKTYNDGLLHSVFLSRDETIVRLRVDDSESGSGTLADQETIGSLSSQLFIGGFPDKIKPSASEMPVTESLIGCISNIFLNYKLVPIVPEAHLAIIGNCPAEQLFSSFRTPERAADEPQEDGEQRVSDRKASKLFLHITEPTLSTFYQLVNGDNGKLPTDITVIEESKPTTKRTTTILTSTKALETDFDSITLPVSKRDDVDECPVNLITEKDDESGAQFGITESSHSRLNFDDNYPHVNQFKIELAFRTRQADGMLWIWANYKNYSRYFCLKLNNGTLELEIKGHKQPKTITYKSAKLDDGKWHYVRVQKQDHEILLKVDAYPVRILKGIPNAKVTSKRIYIGGILSKHRKLFAFSTPQFSGCIKDFFIDDVPRDLLSSSRDVIPCVASSKSAYVHDGGYLLFDPLRKMGHHKNLQMTVQFLPAISNGLIFGLMTNTDFEQTRITLYMRDGMMTFELIYYKERRDLKHVFEKSICDGKWHNLMLDINKQHIVIQLDSDSKSLPTKTNVESISHFRSLPVFFGGAPASAANRIGVPSMVGCFRNFTLSGKKVSLKAVRKLSKVVPYGCPYNGE